MGVAVQIAQILFILSVLVILHEFGHYLTARWFKVRAEKFYLFMDAGFSIFKMKKINGKWQYRFFDKPAKLEDEVENPTRLVNKTEDNNWANYPEKTEWGIGWLPLGGYVKLAGMIDESMDKDQLKEPPKSYEFRSKPAWQRLIILLGGIIVNILLAILIYTVTYSTVGQTYASTEKYQENGLYFTEVGQKMGFENGDKILNVDGKSQKRFDRMVIDVLLGNDIAVDRNGETQHIQLSDENIKDILGNEGRGFIQPRMPAVVDSVVPNSGASQAGLRKGDIVQSINGKKVEYYDQVKPILLDYTNQKNLDTPKKSTDSLTNTIPIQVQREGQPLTLRTTVSDSATLGYINQPLDTKRLLVVDKMPLGRAFTQALDEAYTMFVYNIKQFKLIIKPKTEAYKQIKSPVGITRMLPQTWNWQYVWNFMAFFSIALAFMNLLPIPGLDGGHALFTIVEMITGKTMSEKMAGMVQTAGMIFLLSLMALIFGKDIWEIIVDNLNK